MKHKMSQWSDRCGVETKAFRVWTRASLSADWKHLRVCCELSDFILPSMTCMCLESHHKYKYVFFFIMVSSFYDYKGGGSLNRRTRTPGIVNCCFISVHSAPASGQTPVSFLNLSLFVSFPLFSCQTLSFILISPPLTLFPFFSILVSLVE